MNRLEEVRRVVNETLDRQGVPEKRAQQQAHLYGVSVLCAQFAVMRALDAELGAIIGLLHDLWAYCADSYDGHAHKGAQMAREILTGMGCFSEEEIGLAAGAIHWHDDITEVHGPYDELLKDGDILFPYFLGGAKDKPERARSHIDKVLEELGIKL